ncbi:Maf family protein [Parvularcula sp. LCG005]|uniref:Maf family protein n=1 Tax=Parvularcula sp. LCG005 TaxID=3078805 RepID=UPI00294215EF|nr:Maf family protein [Parvularcula sp. LCG005]WOI53313.1 Maf family protein [Parvularcula sp. LCG005]
MTKIVLASKSLSRQALLSGTGLTFDARASDVDESVIKAAELAKGTSPADIALLLAEAKALACNVAPDDIVIGGDQVMEFDGRLYDKPLDIAEAKTRLHDMAGREHHLRSGLVLAQGGEIIWRHQDTATLWMRPVTHAELDGYFDVVGDRVLATVGAYELEGPGVRLFERIEGDYFTILGLSVMPLMAALRARGLIPW